MSRPSSMAQRPLTLTEELEKLEQSITLTLQEIDHNFSQAHRIVTTSILPLIEQYSENSRDVWEGAKFWKQFFEASANVSLSGYEEKPEDATTTLQEDEDPSLSAHEQDTQLTAQQDESHLSLDHREHEPELELTALSLSSHSTPRPYDSHHHHNHHHHQQANDTTVTSSIAHPSPYLDPDSLPDSDTRDLARAAELADAENEDSFLPTTPGKYSASASAPRSYRTTTTTQPQQQHQQSQYPPHHDESHTPLSSSPFIPPAPTSTHEDPILHRFHDKTYRVQATPLSKKRQNLKHYLSTSKSIKFTNPMFATTPEKPPAKKSKYSSFDDSPISSPEPEAPQLHAEIFSSPMKGGGGGGAETPNTGRKRRPSAAHGQLFSRPTPKPGMSVLTPMKGGGTGRRGWDSDDDDDDFGVRGYGGTAAFSDEDEDLGPSPPKTMQFHIPQSRLMKTPAKEASKRIVEDLLLTAGANDTTDDIVQEQSPSVIRRVEKLEDETF
ncbi:DASH complex subunit ASK1 [Aspergillus homomorphus CBS 101889]|uniref:DASH complex subunit ASK1 n=1 Tax=Aspergillus homomorphus (strain CBS 101889) TaxID=1450537 RepID=A0A395HUC7_ASPHC|nr:hypothetical protein BO97DRAFT_406353 [Aspergillus homomorphus CBS 101889]RAL11119.1 hypothetical protein BO97DRAFT_406353 [Aspergillus homomorphus CBS 101889]